VIRTSDRGDVQTVTLDRPERRNALTPAALDAIADAVEEPPTPVVYLRGAGPAFCAGADLDDVAAAARASGAAASEDARSDVNAPPETADGTDIDTGAEFDDESERSAAAFARRGQVTANAIESSPAVVVAGIDGAARGGGVELALACDVRIATPRATFGEPGVCFGLFGAWGGTHRLVRILGEGVAADLALSGRVVDAEEALRTGLISRIREDPRAVAREIAANDAAALARLKPLMRATGTVDERERAERAAFEALMREHAESLADRKD
jgi:enoyl-CoA hydratase/carnithine racemase